MRRIGIVIMLAIFLLVLSGCSWLDGSYVHLTPHRAQTGGFSGEELTAKDESEFRKILEEMVSSGQESAVIYAVDLDMDEIDRIMRRVETYILTSYPIGAYAVEDMSYELGIGGGKTAVAVKISYHHTMAEIQRIPRLKDLDEAAAAVEESLRDCDPRTVFFVEKYEETDFSQMVQNLALTYPEAVMETPRVEENVFGSGASRVVELQFTYENDRDVLRQMQTQVKPVFESAVLYVSGEGSDSQKFGQLYGFLMERFDYQVETSITPAYSLLRHGVGDSRAFATVYAAMCRMAGLDCQIVTGTRQGEPWVWNMVFDEELPYHVDLLACSQLGGYREMCDAEMTGYVWDYSAYPASNPKSVPQEESDPQN